MGNCLLLRARGWGIDRQVRKKLQIPGGVPGGMVTGRIEPCIILFGKRIRSIRFKIQRSCFRSELFVRKLVLFCSTYKLGFALTLHP